MDQNNNFYSMQSILKWHLILFVTCTLFGCAGFVRYEREYTYPPKPLQEIAILTHIVPDFTYTRISKLNGKALKTYSPQLIELPAGKHRFDVGFASKYSWSTSDVTIELDTEPGHVYVVYIVDHTHKETWYPAIWDVTTELRNPRYKSFVNKIDAILKKNRPNEILPSIASLSSVDSTDPIAGLGSFWGGICEEMQGNLKTWVGEDVDVTYYFYRYEPFTLALAYDSEGELIIFHIQLNPVDGSIVNVLGKGVYVKDARSDGFQPLNSDLVYVFGDYGSDILGDKKPLKIYKQASDGTLSLVSN